MRDVLGTLLLAVLAGARRYEYSVLVMSLGLEGRTLVGCTGTRRT